jgi:hypothetical protein
MISMRSDDLWKLTSKYGNRVVGAFSNASRRVRERALRRMYEINSLKFIRRHYTASKLVFD